MRSYFNLAQIWCLAGAVKTRPLARGLLLALLLAAAALAGGPARAAKTTVLVAFGDSLTAGLGLKARDAFPRQLQRAIEARGRAVTVVDAGVSGDTTTAALARLDWAVPRDADAVIVELGANDALRGQDPEQAYAALDKIITRFKGRGLAVLLAGMQAPPNMGAEYADAFNPIYARLAKKHDVALYPFFLEGVAGAPKLNQSDGIHPTARGVERIVEGILPYVERLLDGLPARAPGDAG